MKNSHRKPPEIGSWLLERIMPEYVGSSAFGDYEEIYNHIFRESGYVKANLWFWLQIIKSIPIYIFNTLIWRTTMLRNYIKTAIRNLMKQKVNSAINIFGLSIGLTCCILIYLFVEEEYSFDRFHINSDSLYRVLNTRYLADGSISSLSRSMPTPMGPALTEYFNGIEHITRFSTDNGVVQRGGRIAGERIAMADAPFFEMFSFPLILGNPRSALANDNSIVLTSNIAAQYFRNEDPMGKTLTITFGQNKKEFIVTGIAEEPPSNSTIQFSMLVNYNNVWMPRGQITVTNWNDFSISIYVQLPEKTSPEIVTNKFPAFTEQHFGAQFERSRSAGFWKGEGNPLSFDLQPMKDIHLDTRLNGASDPVYSYILSGIALIVLIIACMNYMILAVGRSSARSQEIGIRKVLGAGKKELIRQFWSESVIMTLLALTTGLIIAYFVLPVFNDLSNKQLSLGTFASTFNITALILLMLIVGIGSGSYPALVMSAFRPVEIFRGKLKLGGKNFFTRSAVVIQFSLSIFLIISTIILGKQIEYMINKDQGYDKEGIVVINTQEGTPQNSVKIINHFKDRATQYSSVINVTGTNVSFGRGSSAFPLEIDGRRTRVFQFHVDPDYLKTIGIALEDGRDFSFDRSSDTTSVIINRKLVNDLKMDSPIGKLIGDFVDDPLTGYPFNLRIIGVVNDFHFLSLQNEIGPTIIHMVPGWSMRTMIARISTDNISDALTVLGNTWDEIQPDKPFSYTFLDEDVASMYTDERRWSTIIRYSSIFAVVISCMGVFGLTSIAISRRVKEIGIRKVLGAGVFQLVSLVTREFVVLVLAANVIAWPLAYYAMNSLLSDYYYRIGIGIQYFLAAGLLTVGIAVCTILYLAVKAALSNPIEALRYE